MININSNNVITNSQIINGVSGSCSMTTRNGKTTIKLKGETYEFDSSNISIIKDKVYINGEEVNLENYKKTEKNQKKIGFFRKILKKI